MDQGSFEVKTWKHLVAVPWLMPERNVGDPIPCPQWWVINRRTGNKVGQIFQEPSGAFYFDIKHGCASTLYGAMAAFEVV